MSIAAQSLVARDVKLNPQVNENQLLCVEVFLICLTDCDERVSLLLQRAQKLARMLLGFGAMLGVALMGVVASVHYLGSSWLTADPNVQHLVQSVTLQNMFCELFCSVALVVEGTAIAAGKI